MMDRLREIHEESVGQDTDEGAMIVTFEGYICGNPNLFTTDANEAFCFKDRAQAELFYRGFSRCAVAAIESASAGSSVVLSMARKSMESAIRNHVWDSAGAANGLVCPKIRRRKNE